MGKVNVFEGEVVLCDCEISHPTVGDYKRKNSLLDELQDLEGKRIRVTVEVLDG